jgi:hypothetical protein
MDERLDDLVPRVAVSDIAYQLTARQSTPLDELGLPSYYWGECALNPAGAMPSPPQLLLGRVCSEPRWSYAQSSSATTGASVL